MLVRRQITVFGWALPATAVAIAVLAPVPAAAHLVGPINHGDNFSPWLVDPAAVILLILVGWIYWRGCRRSAVKVEPDQSLFRRRQKYFWAGWSVLAIALASPLDPLGEQLFSAHMVQHELMMLVAAPLLVLSRPTSALLRGCSMAVARLFGTVTRVTGAGSFWALLVSPVAAWMIHAVGLWGWHFPDLFAASLTSTWIHALQHFSFLLVALIFWYALIRPHRANSAIGVIYLFTTALHASLLGALLTFSSKVWYTPYLDTAPAWGLTALQDQQLGGLIMWMPAGVVFIAAGLLSLANTLRASDDDNLQVPSHTGGEK